MRLDFHPEARAEFLAAVRAYRAVSEELGSSFLAAALQAADRLQRYPQLGPVLRGEFRRHLIARFPYALVYRAEAERIYILAVMHLRRRPGYWRHRR